MSEEEKKAIKNVEKFVYSILNGISAYDCKVILNIIEKQQKELEDLKDIQQQICNEELFTKEYVDKLRKEIQELKEKNMHITKEIVDFVNSHYISKDKIKAKIEELNDINSEFSKRVIKGKEVYLTELVQNILQEFLEKE